VVLFLSGLCGRKVEVVKERNTKSKKESSECLEGEKVRTGKGV